MKDETRFRDELQRAARAFDPDPEALHRVRSIARARKRRTKVWALFGALALTAGSVVLLSRGNEPSEVTLAGSYRGEPLNDPVVTSEGVPGPVRIGLLIRPSGAIDVSLVCEGCSGEEPLKGSYSIASGGVMFITLGDQVCRYDFRVTDEMLFLQGNTTQGSCPLLDGEFTRVGPVPSSSTT